MYFLSPAVEVCPPPFQTTIPGGPSGTTDLPSNWAICNPRTLVFNFLSATGDTGHMPRGKHGPDVATPKPGRSVSLRPGLALIWKGRLHPEKHGGLGVNWTHVKTFWNGEVYTLRFRVFVTSRFHQVVQYVYHNFLGWNKNVCFHILPPGYNTHRTWCKICQPDIQYCTIERTNMAPKGKQLKNKTSSMPRTIWNCQIEGGFVDSVNSVETWGRSVKKKGGIIMCK